VVDSFVVVFEKDVKDFRFSFHHLYSLSIAVRCDVSVPKNNFNFCWLYSKTTLFLLFPGNVNCYSVIVL